MIIRGVILLSAVFFASSSLAKADSARIKKVLPHLLDQQGRHLTAPSLFARDTYQAELRLHPDKVSAIRFDTQWKASSYRGREVRMKLEVRGSKMPPRTTETFEGESKKAGAFSRWTHAKISAEDYQRIGSIIAWRVTLWAGDTQIAEQKSFLW